MLNHRKPVLLSLVLLLCSVSVQAATWTVEKDGSGDFSVIQHAVDAAGDGDTILIGPGRYVDFEPYDTGSWVKDIIIVIVDKNDLTLIGSGVDETIIGPSENNSPYAQTHILIMGWHANNNRLEGLSVENCGAGIVWDGGSINIANCSVFNCYRGIYSFTPDGTNIENSEFFQQGGWSILTNGDCRDVTIEDCSFHGYGTGIGFNWTPNANVISCQFEGLNGAIGYSGNSTGQVTSCTTSDVRGSVELATGSQVHLLDNFLEATWFSLYVASGSFVSGTGNVFSGGSSEYGTLFFSSWSSSGLTGNHIFKGEGPIVTLRDYHYEHYDIDLTNNYWGTTDIETIEEWIHDGNDDSSIHGTVSFLPLADGPVSTESTSWDSLKAMFR